MALYLGIDGGGVKTTAVAANEKGKIIIKVLGGTIDYNAVGMASAAKNLKYISKMYSRFFILSVI